MFGSRKPKEPPGPRGAAGSKAGGTQAGPHDKRRDAASNGGEAPAVQAPSSEEAQRQAAVAIRQSLAFAQIISVLMRSPHYKHYTLADLEWLVLPPLLTGQFSVAEAGDQQSRIRMPLAVALWANVSSEVDKRLSENLSAPLRLRPDEWRSGDIPWLVDAVGDARMVSPFLKQLSETVFKGRDVKVRSRGKDGAAQVMNLSKLCAGESQAPAKPAS